MMIFWKNVVNLVNEERKKLGLFFDDHEVEYVPSISNSVMMICDTEQVAADLTQNILKTGMILRQFNVFGLAHFVRITIGTEREMNHLKTVSN